jgi:A/G-specific adenine glycosylase
VISISRSRLRTFRRNVLHWYAVNGRDLPWRRTRDPYAIVVSEIMLHQTQVSRVIPFYERFLRRYPTVQALARARRSDVKRITDPLGYKVRGRWLHAIAQHVAERRAGYFPDTLDELQQLPGVGRYTAGAVMSFAFHRDAPILDTNVARLLRRYFEAETGRSELWSLAGRVIPRGQAHTFNQALMDIGALVCVARKPRCAICPLRRACRMLHA